MAPQKGKKGAKGKANKDPVIQPPAAQVQAEPPQAPEPISVVQSMPGTLHFGSAEPRPVSRSLFTNQPSGMPTGTGLSGAFPSALTSLPEEALSRSLPASPVKREGSVSSNPFLERIAQPTNSQGLKSRSISRRSSPQFMDDWEDTHRSPSRSFEQEERYEPEGQSNDVAHDLETENPEHGRSPHEDRTQDPGHTAQQTLVSGLRPLGRPLSELNDDNSRRLREVSICIPAAQATDGLLEVSDIGTTMARILRCLTYAREGLHRDFQVPHRSFSCNEYRSTFKEFLELIDNSLNEVWEYPLGEGEVGYILDAGHMRKLTKELFLLLAKAEEDLLLLGKGLPALPRWGKEGKWDDIWHSIDFEILSVAYRCEVETFLMKVGDAMLEVKKLEREIQGSPKQTQSGNDAKPIIDIADPPRDPSRPFSSVSQRKARTMENQVEFKNTYVNHDPPPHVRIVAQAPNSTSKHEDAYVAKNPFSKGWTPPTTVNTLQPSTNLNGGRSQTMTLNPLEPPRPNYETRPRIDAVPEQGVTQNNRTNAPTFTSTPPTFNPFQATAAIMPPSYSTVPFEVPRSNLNANIFGNTYVQSSSNRLREITGPTFGNQNVPADSSAPILTQAGGGSGGYPNGDDDGGKDPKKPDSRGVGGPDNRIGPTNGGLANSAEIRFDYKLKVDTIPTWDGDADTLGRWLMRVNSIARQSATVFQQLGKILPTRLTGKAENWYFSLSFETRQRMEYNWDSMKSGICQYYMNSSYMERMRTRANKASYRSAGNSTETPSEYFIRKLEMLQLVYNYNERELITEVMVGTPSQWTTILTPHLYNRLEDFQQAIKFHEDVLLSVGAPRYGNYQFANRDYPRNPFSQFKAAPKAKVNQVGWTDAVKNPPFPKDDSNISKKGTPVSKGGRPCRHCGSDNHWDYECKYARKGERRARVNMVTQSEEERSAQEEYDDLYYAMESDEEENDAEPGFC